MSRSRQRSSSITNTETGSQELRLYRTKAVQQGTHSTPPTCSIASKLGLILQRLQAGSEGSCTRPRWTASSVPSVHRVRRPHSRYLSCIEAHEGTSSRRYLGALHSFVAKFLPHFRDGKSDLYFFESQFIELWFRFVRLVSLQIGMHQKQRQMVAFTREHRVGVGAAIHHLKIA